MKVSKHINPNIIQDGSIDGDKKINGYPPLKKGSGKNSVCQDSCTATGDYSHAEGFESTASGLKSHAEGAETNATEYTAHAEGYHTTASAPYSHSEGSVTEAFGYSAHAEGSLTTASGRYSHAEGSLTYASGYASHAEGQQTIASNKTEHAEGKYNISIPNKTIHTIGIGGGTSNTDRKNAHEIHLDGKHYIYGIGGYDGTNSQIEGIKTVQEVVEEIENKLDNCVDLTSEQTITDVKTFSGGINMNSTKILNVATPTNGNDAANKQYVDDTVKLANNAVQIRYAELKSLRDAGKLVPGTQYRITDYTCTTTQENTRSAGHPFDIIVTADDESALNEVARVALHSGDEYFSGCNLNAWKIWYCLDNDTTRFAWADETDGKGVIYRMIDEWNNDIPYDFKNIQFKHPTDTVNYPYYYYTFASSNIEVNTDNSLSIANNCYSNTISERTADGKMVLNNIIFIGGNCYKNSFGSGCYFNAFAGGCKSNSFGITCYNNTFDSSCVSNTFGTGCHDNTFLATCNGNTFEANCGGNTFGNECSSNSFGNYCNNNRFGNYCYNNTLGNNCYSNTFKDSCGGNAFGNNCNSNTLEANCSGNTFRNNCGGNTFDDNCVGNAFGNNCQYNVIGAYCYNNILGNFCAFVKFAATIKYNYYRYNRVGDGCQYIVFTGAETASSSAQVQNYNFAQGLQGTSSAYLIIDGVRNRSFETKVAKKSNGELKIYCEADLIL